MVSCSFTYVFMCPFSENLSDPGIHEDPLSRRLSPHLPTSVDGGLAAKAIWRTSVRHPQRGCVWTLSAASDICNLKMDVIADLG